MINFIVDKDKCTKCGLCSLDCPVLIINGKTEFPEIKEGKEDMCIKCQHCLAICPTGAISILGKNPEDSIPSKSKTPEFEEMSNMIKLRRSIRKFKQEEVDKTVIQELLETTAYAPTGHNKNAVLLSVVDNKEDLNKLRNLAYDSIKTALEEGNLPSSLHFLSDFQRLWETKKIDVLFRDVPHLLIASAPNTITTPDADSYIALSYFELLANSYGLSTLWNGFLKWVFNDVNPDIRKQIGIPENHIIATVLLFGKPAVKYARSIQSEGLNLNRIKL